MKLKTLTLLSTLCASPAVARHPFVGAGDVGSEPFAALRAATRGTGLATDGGADLTRSTEVAASRAPRFHANARVGLRYSSVPIVVDRGAGFAPDRRVEGAGGPGLAATLEVWPVFAEHAGIGGFASGTAVATVGDVESEGNTGYDMGGMAYLGPDRIASVVGRYSIGYRQAGLVDGAGLGGFGGKKPGAGSVSMETSRWGVGLRGCPVRDETDVRCEVQLEYVWMQESVEGGEGRASVHSFRVDWRGYLGVGAEYSPAWFVAEHADSPMTPNALAQYFAINVEYRNDFFGGAWW